MAQAFQCDICKKFQKIDLPTTLGVPETYVWGVLIGRDNYEACKGCYSALLLEIGKLKNQLQER